MVKWDVTRDHQPSVPGRRAVPVTPLVGILAGGMGRRMGGGKPGRAFGSTTLIGNALKLAAAWSGDIVVVFRRPDQIPPDFPARTILDNPGVEGPLAGLAALFADAHGRGAEYLLTLPCDAPRLPTDLLDRLAAAMPPGGRCVMANSGGQSHPTCALWRTSAALELPAYLATGQRSLTGFANACGAAVARWPVSGGGDPFANANTPEELERLQPGA